MKWRQAGWLVAGVLVVAGTGCTTVTRTALVGAGSGQASGLSVPTAGSTGIGGAAGSTQAGGSTQSAGGVSAGQTGGTGGTNTNGGTVTSSLGVPQALAGSHCSKVLKIGTSYIADIGAVSALGNPSLATQANGYQTEFEQAWQRMADWVNANGGLAGCKVAMVFFPFYFTAADGYSGESQKECASFAQDQHVFADIPMAGEDKTIVTCLAQNHVVDLYEFTYVYRVIPQDFSQYPGYLYQPFTDTPYRYGPYINILAQYGYLQNGTKVGILLDDDGSGTNQYLVNSLWKPKLQAMGINPVVVTFHNFDRSSDASTISNEMSSAVLQFKAAGVDHVMFTPDSGDAALFFTQVAHGQDYHPRYAMTTQSQPFQWQTDDSDQRPNAIAISNQIYDQQGVNGPDPKQLASNAPNQNRAICDSIFTGHLNGVFTSVSDTYQICDSLLFLKDGLQGAPDVSPQALQAGVDRLAGSFTLANGYGNARLAEPNHYDGASAVRVMEWNEPAGEWQYISPTIEIP